MMKICITCKKEKNIKEFEIRKDSKDGYRNQCITCKKEKQKEHYYNPNNKDNRIKKSKEYYMDNKEMIKEKHREYYNNNKDVKHKYVENNIEKISKYRKEWNELNKEYLSDQHKNYYKENQEKIKQKSIDSYYKIIEDDPDYHKKRYKKMKNDENSYNKLKEYRIEYKKNKPHIFAWRYILRSVLRRIDRKKENSTIELLGYSAYELKLHMENLFTEGMSWNNYGEWHIDHIKQVSLFDSDTPISIINSLKNLRPLWSTSRTINGVFYEGNLNRKK